MNPKQPQGLFSLRTAVIVLAAIMFGLVGGTAHYLEYHSVVEALGAGGGTAAVTLGLLHRLIERSGRGDDSDDPDDQDGPSDLGPDLDDLIGDATA